MRTTCPHCASVFRVTAEQLNMAHGQVRCGYCNTVFNALTHLEEDWKEKLPGHAGSESEQEQELVLLQGDLNLDEELEDLEPQDSPPQVYEDESELPVEDILGDDKTANKPNKADSDEEDDELAFLLLPDDDEPSALAELASSETETVTINKPEATPPENITAQAKNLFSELEQNIEQSRQPDRQPVNLAALDEFTRDNEQPEHSDSDNTEDNTKEPAAENKQTDQLPDMQHQPPELTDVFQQAKPQRLQDQAWFWITGLVLCAIILLIQSLYFFRHSLAQNEGTRSMVVGMCNVLGCEVPLRNDIRQGIQSLQMISHTISKIPDKQDQLRIKAIFSNTASYPQAYPVIQVKLADHDNRTTAMRRFKPQEYLAPHIDIHSGLPAKTAIEVFVDVMKPKTAVVSYRFDFM